MRVSFKPTFLILRVEFLLRRVSAEKKAADEGSLGTFILIGFKYFFLKLLSFIFIFYNFYNFRII